MNSTDNEKVIIGLDYGQKRIGVAISVLNGKMAIPHSIISYKKIDDALNKIKKLVLENNAEKVVIGLPITMKNIEGFKAKEVIEFKKVLEEQIKVEIILEDERLSTLQAKKAIDPNSKNKFVDDSSATIILNSFLEKGK